jgi:Amidohydrolase family
MAHRPTAFLRRGIVLEAFGRFRAAGVNLGIGTDTFPHNVVEELRTAAILARVAAGQAYVVTAADIFSAATVGGGRVLGRDDLGWITPGAKADFVMVDIAPPAMQPVYDPVRSLVYAASEWAIRHVFVGGQQVVRDVKALAFDYADASARMEMAQRRAIERVPTAAAIRLADRNAQNASLTLAFAQPGDTLLYLLLPLHHAAFGISLAEAGLLLAANRLVRIAGYGWIARLHAERGPHAACLPMKPRS